MTALFYLAAFVLAIGLLVVIHEFGHYGVARLCGVKVLRFSVGFGKPLLVRKFKADGTEWILAAFPLGGYVKMLDEREGEVLPEEVAFAFNRQSVWKRILIVAAGPIANLLLAVLLYWGVFIYGNEELRPLLAAPVQSSPAQLAGLREGDLVTAVEGLPVQTWSDFRWQLLQLTLNKPSIRLEVINPKREISFVSLDVSSVDFQEADKDPLQKIGLALQRPAIPPVIGKVASGSVAEAAGLMAGDRVVDIDGQAISHWGDMVSRVRAAPGRDIRMTVTRGWENRQFTLRPGAVEEKGETVGRIGVGVAEPEAGWRDSFIVFVSYGPAEALLKSFRQTWDTSIFSLKMMGRMLTGEVSFKNLSGPVSIADYAGQSAKQGILPYIRFLALISISLGVLNLLPIPILDGGHLLYYTAEVIKGGPLSERVMEVGQRIGLTLLGMLMAFALFNDFSRLLSS